MTTGKRLVFSNGRYSISDTGEIISLKHDTLLTTTKDKTGLLWINLISKSGPQKVRVDRLMLFIFKGIPMNSPYPVIYKDENKNNLSLDNIDVDIPKSIYPPRSNHFCKLTYEQVIVIIDKLKEGYSSRKIAKICDCSPSMIDLINKGKTWYFFTRDYTERYPIRKKITISDRQGDKNFRSKLTEEKVRHIKKLLKKRRSVVSIAEQFGVNPTTISKIKTGKNWAHVR